MLSLPQQPATSSPCTKHRRPLQPGPRPPARPPPAVLPPTPLSTLSSGSVWRRNQPTTACPASWYATVLRSSAEMTWRAGGGAKGGRAGA